MKFPHYYQLDAMDCGPCCLRMIAKHYGKHYTLKTLKNKCHISHEGVSMLAISEAAEKIGFKTIGLRISFKQLCEEAELPCILHWNQNHFVVCYNITKNRKTGKHSFFIADPASQLVKYNEEEFLNCWYSTQSCNIKQGSVLLLTPRTDFHQIDEEIEVCTKHSILFFLKYLLPYKKQLFLLLLGVVIGSILQMIFPFLTQSLVDVGIKDKNISFISLILISQLFLFFAQLFVGFIRSWVLLHINARVDIALISDFLIKLMKLPLKYFDSKLTGDLMQRIGDHSRIKSFLMGNSVNVIFSILNFIIFSIILGYYNFNILTIFLIGNSLYVLWIVAFLRFRRELDIKRFNQSANEQSNVIQLIQGMQEIKLNNCELRKRWDWERIQIKLFKINMRGLSLGQIQQSGSVFLSQTTNIIISYIAAYSVIKEDMTLGMMMSLTYIIGQLSTPISEFMGFVQSFQDAKISLERLNEIHGCKDEDNNKYLQINHLSSSNDIVLENVAFSYSGAHRDYALDGLNLVIPGQKITAIVGASGSGKTTLIKLLLGFYEPLQGIIKVGGTPLSLIQPQIWRKNIGSVMQDGFIFSDTIANNIAISTDDVDVERLRNSVNIANIGEYINSLPLGFSTKIGMEGNGISQGQKQRILIARAVYKNPEIIFFDEATNSLDANNEKIIMENLHEFYKGKTVVIVAHRLSTVRNADKIIVLDKGKVVEEGTHNELTAIKGKYYTLVKNQLELGYEREHKTIY